MMNEEGIRKHNARHRRDQVIFWLGGVALWIYVLFIQ